MKILAIWAESYNGVLGVDNKIPWKLSVDLQNFKALTHNSTVIMGRKTWESLPKRPLINRENFVVSSTVDCLAGATVFRTLAKAVTGASTNRVCIIGGREMYKESFNLIHTIYQTIVHEIVTENGAVLAPDIPNSFKLEQSSAHFSIEDRLFYAYNVWQRG